MSRGNLRNCGCVVMGAAAVMAGAGDAGSGSIEPAIPAAAWRWDEKDAPWTGAGIMTVDGSAPGWT